MPPLQSDSMSTFCRFLSPRSTLWRRSAETLLRLTMTVVSHAAMAPMQAMLRPKLRAQASPHSTFCHHRRLRNPLPALRMLGLREHFVKLKLSVFGLGIFTPGVSSFRKLSVECAQTDAAAVTETVPANFTQEGFEAFLVNLQSSICDEAAAADGRGRFLGLISGSEGRTHPMGMALRRYWKVEISWRRQQRTCL